MPSSCTNSASWRLVKKLRRAAGSRLDQREQCGIDSHSRRKTALNHPICYRARMHEEREFAGHSDLCATELCRVREGEDGK